MLTIFMYFDRFFKAPCQSSQQGCLGSHRYMPPALPGGLHISLGAGPGLCVGTHDCHLLLHCNWLSRPVSWPFWEARKSSSEQLFRGISCKLWVSLQPLDGSCGRRLALRSFQAGFCRCQNGGGGADHCAEAFTESL